MPYPAGPVALALGTAVTLPIPSSGSGYNRVVVDNLSGYACTVNAGGPAPWLQPFTSELYQLTPGDTVQLTPTVAPAASVSTPVVTCTWYRDDETITGTYPAALVAQAVTASLTGNVGVVNPSSGDTTKISTALAQTSHTYTLPSQVNFGATAQQSLFVPIYTTTAIEQILYFDAQLSGYCANTSATTYTWYLLTAPGGTFTGPTVNTTPPTNYTVLASGTFSAGGNFTENLVPSIQAYTNTGQQVCFAYAGDVGTSSYTAAGSSFQVIQTP